MYLLCQTLCAGVVSEQVGQQVANRLGTQRQQWELPIPGLLHPGSVVFGSEVDEQESVGAATEVFKNANISVVIWANHMIRASIAAMEKISQEINNNESVTDIEDRIASVNKIFSLQGVEELSKAQERYLHSGLPETRAIVLAASRGTSLHELTHDKPKVMLKISGKTLLRRLLDKFKRQHINKTTVVAGYKADAIDTRGIELSINPDYETTGELASLLCAKDAFHKDMVITYGDLLFRGYILRDLLNNPGDLVIVVDSASFTSASVGAPKEVPFSRAFCTALRISGAVCPRMSGPQEPT